MILIKDGFIVENNELVKKDILIENEKITKIDDNINVDCKIIDAKGCLVMPGGVDVHVHLREPGFENKETIKTGSMSALKGGFTTIMAMPNLNPVPDCLKNLNVELKRIEESSLCNIYPYGSISVGEMDEVISNISELAPYVKAITDDGKGVNNLDILENACKMAKEYNLVVASHAEDKVYKYAPEGEYIAVRREIEIAKKIGCKYHFCHMSTKESFDAIRKAHALGYTNITCEVAPHHLVLNEEMINNNPNFKMNPPLRSEENRLATVEALLDGTAIMVATDHAPHALEDKNKEYSKCANGIIGLETCMPIIYTEFVKKNLISLDKFLEIMVYNPSKVFNLPIRKIEVGSIADIAILDIENPHTYSEGEILSKGKNSPYIGYTYYGFNKYTLLNGKIMYRRED